MDLQKESEGKMKRFFKSLCVWVRHKLFLDFYLDRRWTVRFRILNFLSGGVLLYWVITAHTHLKDGHKYDGMDVSEELRQHTFQFNARRAEYWLDKAVNSWKRKERKK